MRYLTAEEILFIHYRIIEQTGGSHGIRDTALLDAAAQRPTSTFDGKDLYPDIFFKAAALMQSLIKNHPFVDGNKRTAITAVSILLSLNGKRLNATNKELERFTIKVAVENVELIEIAGWFMGKTG